MKRPLRGAALAYLVLLRMEVAAFHPSGFDTQGLVSVALFVTSPCQGVTLHPALRSPDFPPSHLRLRHGGCQADSRLQFYRARRSLGVSPAGGGP